MKAIIKARELNDYGVFISEIDTDKSYISKSNPKGYFVIVVEPMECNGIDNCIKYQRKDGQLYVEGEGYIIEGNKAVIKRQIDKWIWVEQYKIHNPHNRPKKEIAFVETDLEINFDLFFQARPTDCR